MSTWENLRNTQQNGSTLSGVKVSRHQDVLTTSLYTTHPTLKLPLSQLKKLFLQKLHTVGFPPIRNYSYHWYVVCGSCTSQQTKTSLGETHTTPYRSSCIYVLWTKIFPLWLLHALQPYQICVVWQTPCNPKFRPRMWKGINYQTWSCLTSHDHSRKVIPFNVSPLS